MTTDPILEALDRVARAPEASAAIAEVLRRVTDDLDASRGTMAWEVVPLAMFGDALPPAVAS